MKKILLASACLLTLTACSTLSQNQLENKLKQTQSQQKAKEKKGEVENFFKGSKC